MPEDIENRVSEMEGVLTKLVTIQENQTKQTDKLIESVDKFASMSVLVEQNSRDIGILRELIGNLRETFHVEKENFKEKWNRDKQKMDQIGQGRLWKGVSTAVMGTIFAFGYLYTDIKEIDVSENQALVERTRVISSITNIEKDLNNILRDVNVCKKKRHLTD